MADNKSVFDHLEEIEERLKPKDDAKVTISSLIGEPFDPYFESSTIYYYEEDERKFNKHRKSQITKLFVMLFIWLIPFAFHLALAIVYNEYHIMNLVAEFLFASPTVVYLIYGFNQKRKKIANSKFNMRNHVFYKYEDKLGQEDERGLFSKAMIIYKSLALLFLLVTVLVFVFGNETSALKEYYTWSYLYYLMTISLYFLLTAYSDYYYSSYIFDNKESYVLYEHGTWKKIFK